MPFIPAWCRFYYSYRYVFVFVVFQFDLIGLSPMVTAEIDYIGFLSLACDIKCVAEEDAHFFILGSMVDQILADKLLSFSFPWEQLSQTRVGTAGII